MQRRLAFVELHRVQQGLVEHVLVLVATSKML